MPYTFKYGDRPLDGVTIQRAVGRGGFGEVYYALTDSGKQVALKYLRDNAEVELRGIAHVMNLKSPHLITIYDVKKDAHGDPWVVMEYIGGPSLRDLLIAEPAGLGVQKAAYFAAGIAKGLAYLHERGIVHRDLKPGNIFYDDGYVKIGDYGLSKYIPVSHHSAQTMSVGTVHYMAPEIASGSYTKAIDIYALGVILYEMLTGRLPFAGASMGEILMRHMSEQPDVSGLPEPFAGIVARCLAKDPTQRFQDANELLDRLAAATDVQASIASFDPSTLASAPRATPAWDPQRTMTTPPRPIAPPPLDVRDHRTLQGLGAQAGRLAAKFEARVAEWERRLQRRGLQPVTIRHPELNPAGVRRGRWWALLVLLGVCVGISLALTFLTTRRHNEETVVGLTFALVGAIAAALVTNFKLLPRFPHRSGLMDRFAYATVGAFFLIPAFGVAEEVSNQLQRMMIAPIAVLFLFDWSRLIDQGRRGLVHGGNAILPGIAGLIIAAIADADSYQWASAGVCAALGVLIPTAAGFWPLTTQAAAPPAPPAPPPMGPVARPMDMGTNTWLNASNPAGPAAPIDAAASPPPPPPPPPPAVMQRTADAQPSFAGRATNAGLALLGKLLLLAGIVVAIGSSAAAWKVAPRSSEFEFESVGPGRVVRVTTNDSRVSAPGPAVILPIVVGGVLLLLARRRTGFMHVARALLACVAGLMAIGLALGPAGAALRTLVETGPGNALRAGTAPALLAVGGLVALTLLLLLWPARRRAPRPFEV